MKRITWLALVLALPACGDGTGTAVEFTDPDDLRLQIVSGNGQVGRVQTTSSGAFILAAPPAGVLPDTLVARITDKSGGHANVPPNTVVNYVVPTDGCGEPWISSASPDDSAYVATLWERPAGKLPTLAWHGEVWGSLCTLETRTVVGGVFKTDTTFQAIFTPGPLTRVHLQQDNHYNAPQPPGSEIDILTTIRYGEDAYRNEVPMDTVAAATYTWEWSSRVQGDATVGPSGSGRLVSVPDFGALGYTLFQNRYHARLSVWVSGDYGGEIGIVQDP